MKLIQGHIAVASLSLVVSVSLQSATDCYAFQSSRAGIAVWDTGTPSTTPLTPAALADKSGWTRIPRNQKPESFKGDAVMTNGRVLAVLRKRDSAVEVYSVGTRGTVSRVRLRLQGPDGEPATRLERIAVVENTRGAARLETTYRTANGSAIAARFRVKRGEISIETEPGPGAHQLRVECPGRFVVLPDFFADDILIDARTLPISVVEVPSENFLMHLSGNGDAIAMCVFENSDQDVKVMLSGKGPDRRIIGSEIAFGSGKKIWVALMEAPQIWHTLEIVADNVNKVKQLDWKMPFEAQWRIDFTRTNGLIDSWEILLQEKNAAGYLKPAWLGR
ncbi:MAG: hypothetical protein IH899_07865, partial [Planctomycetes bacterium]|nr:hypothetical protein [Planctomycetota bacterium]